MTGITIVKDRQDAAVQIRKYRTEKHISQRQLAIRSGVSASGIARYETGKRVPSIDKYKQIMAALDVDLYLGKEVSEC